MAKSVIPATAKRVKLHTKEEINDRIYRDTISNIKKFSGKSKEEITSRIKELDKEWDIERALETSASSFVILGTVLGFFFSRWWFVFPGIIGIFLLGHAIEGWCPPLPLFRRMGIRTSSEIDQEKIALKSIRGDFASPYTGNIEELYSRSKLE